MLLYGETRYCEFQLRQLFHSTFPSQRFQSFGHVSLALVSCYSCILCLDNFKQRQAVCRGQCGCMRFITVDPYNTYTADCMIKYKSLSSHMPAYISAKIPINSSDDQTLGSSDLQLLIHFTELRKSDLAIKH